MNAKTITTKPEIARRRVDIRTPSSAAKSPRPSGAYSFAAPITEGWPFSLGLSETSCRDVRTVKPIALRVKRKSYIAKGLLLSAVCTDSHLSIASDRGHYRHVPNDLGQPPVNRYARGLTPLPAGRLSPGQATTVAAASRSISRKSDR